jgi:hypothetical protein
VTDGLDYQRSNYNKIRSVSLVMMHMDRQTDIRINHVMLRSCCTGSIIRAIFLPTNALRDTSHIKHTHTHTHRELPHVSATSYHLQGITITKVYDPTG